MLSIALAVGIYLGNFGFDVLQSWLTAVNVATFLFYGYDKLISGGRTTRIPERVLLVLVVLGGSVGALSAMALFRHKTRKISFQLQLMLLLAMQVACIFGYYKYLV